MTEANPPVYRVLARKYRPQVLSELVGQDVLVRTLNNAFASGRVAHAFLLTGVRGTGKTTTARIIARALNCIGPDGKGGPTLTPCGVCDPCRAIADGRHVDVLEIDAASHTKVDEMRALLDGIRYAPVSARSKVYVLDEVHMLSTASFNALLKTLEEPPPHVTFVFATTEVRKVPLTVLSRCQRFDLRRVEPAVLAAHLGAIAAKENVAIEDAALQAIARAAEGSVRDSLSLLDQAMALGQDKVTEAAVQEMLGLADRGRTLDLLVALFSGDVPAALGIVRDLYNVGADPVLLLQDLLELVHWLTRQKAVPNAADTGARTKTEHERGVALSQSLAMPVLARAWQMLLKGLEEAQIAPDPLTAAEMILVRLAYVADLPPPAEVVERLNASDTPPRPRSAAPAPAAPPPRALAAAEAVAVAAPLRAEPAPLFAAEPPSGAPTVALSDYRALVALAGERREPRVYADLYNFVHLVRFEPGRLEFRADARAARDLSNRLSGLLATWTGRPWVVAVSNEAGAPTLREQDDTTRTTAFAEAEADPTVQAVLAEFPGAKIREVRTVAPPPAPIADAAAEAVPVTEPEPGESEE